MKTKLSNFKIYQIKDKNTLKRIEGGKRTEYQNCIIRAIIADDDFDSNQNEWQDICSNLYGSPTD